MSDERDQATGTTGGATGTTPQGADGSAPLADGSAAVLSAEELATKLRQAEEQIAEERRKNEQLLSEKTNVERMRREAEEQARGTAFTPPTAGAPADPYAQGIAALTQSAIELQSALNNDPTNTVLRSQAVQAAVQLQSLQREQSAHYQQMQFNQMNHELLSVPKELRDRVVEKIMRGEASSVKAAREAVEGITASAEVGELRKQLAAREAEIARMRDIGQTADVATGLRGTAQPVTGKEITAAQWAALQADPAKAAQAEKDYYEGKIHIRQ